MYIVYAYDTHKGIHKCNVYPSADPVLDSEGIHILFRGRKNTFLKKSCQRRFQYKKYAFCFSKLYHMKENYCNPGGEKKERKRETLVYL